MLTPRTLTKFKNAVLGQRFDLSVSTVTRATMRTINRQYRGKDVPTDILSFSLSKNSGEIILCLPEVRTHAKRFGMTFDQYLPYLVIHGLVHIKGHDHGAIMTRLELKYCTALGVLHPEALATNGTAHRSRH